jgi:hypothetical protein
MEIAAGLVLLNLVLLGVVYNFIIAKYERFLEPYTALLVVGGVLFTLIGAAFLVGWTEAGIVGICFAASGAPMLIGSITRNVCRQRDMVERELRRHD